ncbi:MAG TPA: toll/interleukin-1 receptor domain-containing protein [Allosphingosinicella sp.]|nr:toll/interleukin-1 receptor domain-containing protein [Allosphingosinicella sp.]
MANARYTAFLSYSHRDAAEARSLHRRLEAYRIPARLVGAEGEHGPVPARLSPIFRDREELPAAGDLSEKVRAALAASEHLIVICSPDSAASPWVGREIALFRELHPGRPILAAIVAGEPGLCFPAGLAEGGVEPLAADLRPDRDGRRLGFLKLVAGLAGVGLDDLVQRDAARRLRRVTWVTAGALAAMLVMAVMTTLALNARAEAQRQRAEAEGLVEFMLTDLRDKLKAVGRLDIMQAVNDRALHYYGRRADAPVSREEASARSARLYQAIGMDDLAKDDLPGALAAFRKSKEITRRQLALFPGDPQLQFNDAKSENGIGRVHEMRGEWNLAELHYHAYATAADPLAAAALGEAASAAINLGTAAAGRQDHSLSERHFRKAVGLLEMAVQLKPHDEHLLSTLANAEAGLADTFYRRALWASSLAARQRQHAIMARLRTLVTRDAEADFRYAAADRGLACSLWKTGDRRAAGFYFAEAYETVSRLTRQDPRNIGWRSLRQKLGDDLARGGLTSAAGTTAAALKADLRGTRVQGCTG